MLSKTRLWKRMVSLAAVAVMVIGCVALPIPESEAEEITLPYMDTTLTFEERAADLVSRMTLDEKVSQLGNRTTAISRLGVPWYDFWSECLHGVARQGEATSFPYSIAMAASWDPQMIEAITDAISDEARGYATKTGRLAYFSPTINMARDPRWGRNHETYGEDPFLTGEIGASFVKGLQGDDEKYTKIIATIKHYAANNSEYNRHTGDSQMDERTLREYYTRAFKSVISQVDVGSAMSSYNRVNGYPASVSPHLLDTLLRKTFGFNGYVVSDCGAIQDITENHKWIPEGWDRVVTKEESVNFSLLAGCDMDCGSIYPNYAKSAVETGVMSEDTIDLALVRIFTQRMKTGEFDPVEIVPYRSEEYSFENQVEAEDHKQLAEDSANDGIVMLKNDGILPLDINTQKNIVMIGKVANQVDLNNYSGSPSAENMSTPIQGMEALGANVTYIQGGVTASTGSYICNMKDVVINKANGDKVVLKAANAKQLLGCRYESGNGNIGYISPSATLMFENVDIKDIVSVTFQLAGDNSSIPGTVTMTMDSPSGMQVAEVTTPKTGGWQTYQNVTSNVGDTGGYETKDLYLTFNMTLQDVTFSAEQTAQIKNADAVIVCLEGNSSGEGTDRNTIVMPSYQMSLAKTAANLNDKTVVYMQTVGVLEVESFKDDVNAILWTSFNGQAQGNAMARVIYGVANPTAKLPVTWYAKNAELPTIDDYNIRGEEGFAGWSYQYYTGSVTYPFGYGLSYSTYEYSNLRIEGGNTYTPNDDVTVKVDVKNTSNVDGREVVQLYVAVPNNDGIDRPFKQLKSFEKVAIAAGETKTVTLNLDLADCYFWDDEAQKNIYDQGEYTLFVGPSSDEKTALTTKFVMDGELTPELTVLTAQPDGVVLNAANSNKVLHTDVTATMSDDSFYDLTKEDSTVTFTSANEDVATVDENGVVRPVAGGVTTITATVTIDGKTMTDSFPVVVKVELESIEIDGEVLDTFRPIITEYYVPVDGSNAPVVTVPGVPAEYVTIDNATSVPGTATVTISMAGVSGTYTIHFTQRSNDYVVTRFSAIEGVHTVSNKTTLGTGWKAVDGGKVVDFTTHDLSDLHLRMVLKLEQTGNAVIADEQAYRSGFIKLRSTDKNGENNVGWYVGHMGLKTGTNFIDIPMDELVDAKAGTIDWTCIDRINLYIDSLNNYEGPFVATISNTMVVDTSLNPERESLWDLVNDGVDESLYTESSLVAYRKAKTDIQSLIFSADSVTEEQVAAVRTAYETAKAGLREDVYLIGTFTKSQTTSTVLNNGQNRKDFTLYNDWKDGDGVPFDLSGDRSDLRLQMTVTFNSENPNIKPEEVWSKLTIKLRSSDEAGRDGNPNNAEHNYGWDFTPDMFEDKAVLNLSIDLSSECTNSRGLIDWADIRRMIILSPLSQKAMNDPAIYTQYSVTVSNVKIVDLTNIFAEQKEIEKLLSKSVNLTNATAEQKKAYTEAKAAAEKVCGTEMVTPAEVYYAYVGLQDAIDAIDTDEPKPTIVYGDVNGDTVVTAEDALLALQGATNKINLNDTTKVAADANGDTAVTAEDALMILQYATKKIDVFPVENAK